MVKTRKQLLSVVLAALLLLLAVLTILNAQDLGIKSKKPVFGGACKACPWGVLAAVVKDAMQPYGYDVQLCYNCAQAEAPRLVADAKMPPPWKQGKSAEFPPFLIPAPPDGPVDFGATSAQNVWAAYQGTQGYAGERKRTNLRLFANIQSPTYFAIAVKSDLGITDLSGLKTLKRPIKVLAAANDITKAILGHYGLSQQEIEAAGGRFANPQTFAERKDFDVVMANASMGNAPEYNVWLEISQKFDLTFLELPRELLVQLAKENYMEVGTIPLRMYRGVDRPISALARTGTVIYGRQDAPADFAYTVAKAMDEHQDLLQWSSLNFSYNVRNVWKAYGIPLHPGAEKYYRERGYIK